MYKIMIVDDEYYFRQALKVTLPWGELGFEIVGEAKNGEEALARMAELGPDIVLVDINMPIMDGMEYIQNARSRGLEAKFIVLTGHNEFAYARQAVQLGIYNYVLKPIGKEELQSSLLSLKNVIRKERSIGRELQLLKRQASANIPILRERMLNRWLQGNGLAEFAGDAEQLRYLDIRLDAPRFAVIVVDIDTVDSAVAEQTKQLHKLAVREIAEKMVPDEMPFASCYDPNDRFAMILGYSEDSNEGVSDPMELLCESIRQAVRTHLACTVTIGAGNRYDGPESISVSYKEAMHALKHRFVLGGDQVIHHSMIAETGMRASLFTLEKRSNLLMCLRIGDASETESWIAAFFREALSRKADMEMILLSAFEIVSTCLEFLAEMSQSFERIFAEEGRADLVQQIGSMDSVERLESWLRAFILRAMSHAHDGKQSRAVKVVEEVKRYIQSHYGNEELRIEDIAKHVHMNYNHLCYVFKKETSTTINDYLTELRIHRAKELFDQGVQFVQYVAGQVGYADANYFGKCFKKYIGISPSQYIKNLQ